jgi:hypothetical protein
MENTQLIKKLDPNQRGTVAGAVTAPLAPV